MATKLIIGIGNPDPEYHATRHNIGWIFVDHLAKTLDAPEGSENPTIRAWITKTSGQIAGMRPSIILAKPDTYVNTTGPVVVKLKTLAKAKTEDIVIVQDDLDIPFGNVKLSFDKNSGGHRGVESIMKALKTKKFYRLRLGTGNAAVAKAHRQSTKAKDESIKKFVLSKFTPTEQKELKVIFKRAMELLASKGSWSA